MAVAGAPATAGPPATAGALDALEGRDQGTGGAEDLLASWVAPTRPRPGPVPTGPWGRPLRPDDLRRPAPSTGSRSTEDPSQPHFRPQDGSEFGWPAQRLVAPPPPPPGLRRPAAVGQTRPGDRHRLGRTTVTPGRLQVRLRLRGRRWVVEAAGAAGLLAVLAAVLTPAAPPPPDPGQVWAARVDPLVVSLGQDVVALQSALGPGAEPAPAFMPAVRRLGQDLRRAGAVPAAPDPALSRPWDMAVRQAFAAVFLFKSGPDPGRPSMSAARADLDQAGQALVAVAAAIRSPGSP